MIFKFSKIGLFISSIFILSGCSHYSETEKSVVSNISELKEFTAKGFYQNDIIGVKKEMTLPAYIGPSLALSESEYLLLKYAEKNLLFSNYGIKDRLFILTGNKSPDEKNNLAKSYGFIDFKHMFEYFFYFYNNKNEHELKNALSFLENKKLISSLDIFSKENINLETDKLIQSTYYNYFIFENSNSSELKKEWSFLIDKEKIAFIKDDYKPYAFILTLIKELINNQNKEGVQLYGI